MQPSNAESCTQFQLNMKHFFLKAPYKKYFAFFWAIVSIFFLPHILWCGLMSNFIHCVHALVHTHVLSQTQLYTHTHKNVHASSKENFMCSRVYSYLFWDVRKYCRAFPWKMKCCLQEVSQWHKQPRGAVIACQPSSTAWSVLGHWRKAPACDLS